MKDGSYSCSPCDAGFFKSIGNINKCTPCPRNTYGSVNDTKKCFDCPRNSNGPIGATSSPQCKCNANYFKDSDDNECKLCPPNAKLWYSEGVVDNVCKCYKNYYKIGSGVSMECRECQLNSNSEANSTSIDQCACNSNYYKHNNQCKQCPNNAIQLHNSGAPDNVCICSDGYYKSGIADAMECVKCPQNSNSPLNATSIDQCLCINGFSHPALLSTSCVQCPVGKRSANGICTECSAGSYQDREGQDNCIECPKDTYAVTVANTAISQCLRCSDHLQDSITLHSKSISADACVCKSGYYFNSIECVTCPTGCLIIVQVLMALLQEIFSAPWVIRQHYVLPV